MAANSHQQRKVTFRGRVQGVGFRYTTQAIAARHDVVGFVMNLPEGDVQLVAEGAPRALDAFLDEVTATLGHYIASSTQDIQPAGGGFDGFVIRRY